MSKQVDSSHYRFESYVTKKRWSSIWHQLDEIMESNHSNILEIGPGLGLMKAILEKFERGVTTLDIADDLHPDILGSITEIPADDNNFEITCAFQVLEHLPFEMFPIALKEIGRVTSCKIILSLPNAKRLWNYNLYIPYWGQLSFKLPKPIFRKAPHVFDGEHYWEINKKGYELERIEKVMIQSLQGFSLERSYRVPNNPYHHFFVFKKGIDLKDEL